MSDSELKAKLQELEAVAFAKLRLAYRSWSPASGYKSRGEMLESLLLEADKQIQEFLLDNLEDE